MLTPYDFDLDAINDETTRSIMETIFFEHGGQEYDEKYPDGIPTSIQITMKDGRAFDSGLIMYPSGHARNEECNLEDILQSKFTMLGQIAMDNPNDLISVCMNVSSLGSEAIQSIWDIEIANRPIYKD
jgi:2-methylcitrate dehydratase